MSLELAGCGQRWSRRRSTSSWPHGVCASRPADTRETPSPRPVLLPAPVRNLVLAGRSLAGVLADSAAGGEVGGAVDPPVVGEGVAGS